MNYAKAMNDNGLPRQPTKSDILRGSNSRLSSRPGNELSHYGLHPSDISAG